ncbi:cellulose biosynthesis cyclic di-GMP-binding regulatory protein BcsB [Rhizobium sp. YS-1r]|uniref:cellulose biosynthesis cyclic di-GMP-binding regulatory protein BcsB n=1 Tax=Rhizobium sp. YS-1r TaxID=1532558 RepID=UPI00050E7130|nr:cellulose biosynthesis cyclic di-GMP-binding regulatory protein BcsB [Rhizobium sp. YS-1r]KGE02017.1 cytochrome C biogenesis protein CcmF [Rhizobium sp. YS-1r]
MNRSLACLTLALTALLAVVRISDAQPAPFDMSGERPPEPPAPPRLVFPDLSRPPVPQDRTSAPQRHAPAPSDAAPRPAADAREQDRSRRYLVPASDLALAGEYDRRSWSIYLTEEQAASPAKLNLQYQNAIVVAPEASLLTVSINEHEIVRQRISSPNGPNRLAFDVPPNVLHPGGNLVEFRATQRHRTDCDIRSTYDLWTNVDPSQTYLEFTGIPAPAPSVTEAVRAVGGDANGNTEFQFLVPAAGQAGRTKSLLRLAQGLSLLSGMPNQLFSFNSDRLGALGPGKFGVIIGTVAELQPVFPALPPSAGSAATAALVKDPNSDEQVLLLTGPSWNAIDAAVETIVAPTDRPPEIRRDVMATQRWAAPDAPLLFGGERLSFSQLGLRTTEFSGRRFRTSFNIAVPSDFYASAYGEANLLIDAAFAANVRPGSHLDVYVNGNVATNLPITSDNGGLFRHLPIRMTLRHFKPGLNSVSLEAILLTDEDDVCIPGSTASTEPRFALFDSSEFNMPQFARIGRNPSLEALSGTAFPYSRRTDPIMLWMDRFDANTLTATSTFLSRLAFVGGHPITVEPVASPGAIGNRDALFAGSISQIPSTVLSQVNIAPESVATWRAAGAPVQNEDTMATFEKWRTQVRGSIWRDQIARFQEWLNRNFNISLSSFQLLPQPEQVFHPSSNDTFILAQGQSTNGNGSWTVISARTPEELRQGAEALTRQQNWQQVTGRITTYEGKIQKVASLSASRFTFVQTVSPSLGNYRLIAANWLSNNILFYSLALVALAVFLGLSTAALLSSFGRSR